MERDRPLDSPERASWNAEEPLRLLIVGSDSLARSGLVSVLSGQPGAEVVGQLTPTEPLPLSSPATVALLVMDPGKDSTVALDWLRSEAGNVPVLAIATTPAAATEAVAAGAKGALLRDAEGADIAVAARALSRGLAVLDPEMLASLLPAPGFSARLPEPLTGRELEVVQLLAQGLSNKAIGDRLQISEHTAKFHVNAIIGKLGAQTRTEAAVRAIRLGLVHL